MNDRRFLNQSQPQTLFMATLLCYIDAAFTLIGGGFFSGFGIALIAGLGLGGYGVANEKKWGYAVAVAAAVVQFLLLLVFAGTLVFRFPLILNLIFDGALVALLVHPMSRDYQRIWFT